MSRPQTWFRLYNEVADDPKVQRLPDKLFKGWINMMCLSSKNGGVLPPVEDIAYRLRLSEAKAIDLRAQLVSAGLFEEENGSFYPHNWEGRQFKSDVSTGRVKQHRERQRNVSETADETLSTEETIEEQTPKPPPSDFYSPEFEIFWTAYPKKTGKGAAWKAWTRAKPTQPLLTQILSAVGLQRNSTQWRDSNGKYIPNPATWLNERRWEDETPSNGASTRPKSVVL